MFDRSVGGDVLEFGVSGLLHESNLVMYDRSTESLWSQSRGEAIAGEYTGEVLDILFMQVLEFGQVAEEFPGAMVLSTDTGYQRDYAGNPYTGYEESEATFFPVEVEDRRYFAKELFWVFGLDADTSVALRLETLAQGTTSRTIRGREVEVVKDGGRIEIAVEGEPVPGYIEMWFSWATQHRDDGVVWDVDESTAD